MFDAVEDLIRVLDAAGVGPWVKDDIGRNMLVGEWAEQFVADLAETVQGSAVEEADRMANLRDLLDEKPRKTIAVSKIREIIDAE